MKFSKMMFGLFFIATITSCTTTGSTSKGTQTNNSSALNIHWTQNIPNLQPEIRACLISQKMTKKVRYVAPVNATETMVLVDDGSSVQNCRVNSQNYKVITVEPYTQAIPASVPTFYPIGRQTASCSTAEKVIDQQRRLMGTVCR